MFRSSFILYSLLFLTAVACQPQNPAKTIIDKAVAAHGGDNYQNKRITFDFRKFHLVLEQKGGQFRYERTYQDSTGTPVREVLTNDSFARSLNGVPQTLDTAQIGKYSRAVNSIAYFILLPFKLIDPAVQPELVGESQIEGKNYDKIRVRFRAEGGGKDYGDTFFYWFDHDTHTMGYLAYSEGGNRFRKATNPRVIGGIRFQDYVNYTTPDGDTTSVGNFDKRYTAGQLQIFSRIENTNIQVEDLPE